MQLWWLRIPRSAGRISKAETQRADGAMQSGSEGLRTGRGNGVVPVHSAAGSRLWKTYVSAQGQRAGKILPY